MTPAKLMGERPPEDALLLVREQRGLRTRYCIAYKEQNSGDADEWQHKCYWVVIKGSAEFVFA